MLSDSTLRRTACPVIHAHFTVVQAPLGHLKDFGYYRHAENLTVGRRSTPRPDS